MRMRGRVERAPEVMHLKRGRGNKIVAVLLAVVDKRGQARDGDKPKREGF